MTQRRLPMMFAAIALATCATSALAGPHNVSEDAAPSIAVSYADLNLQRDADVQTLLRRLSSAARRVCATFDQGQKGADARHAFEACRSNAMQGGVASIASANLNAAYAARTSGRIVLANQRP